MTVKALIIQPLKQEGGLYHAYIATDTKLPLRDMLRFTELQFKKNGIGMEIYCINQTARGSMIMQIAMSCQTTWSVYDGTNTGDGMYSGNDSLDRAYFDDDFARYYTDKTKEELVNDARQDRPSFPGRPLAYAPYLAHFAVEPFLELSEETAAAIAEDTRSINDDTESLEEYGGRIFKRKVGEEIRERDPEPDWDLWFKVPEDMEDQSKKSRTSGPIPEAQGAVDFIEVAGGAGGSFYISNESSASQIVHASLVSPSAPSTTGIIRNEADFLYKTEKLKVNPHSRI